MASFPLPPLFNQNSTNWLRELSNVLRNVMSGKTNNTGSVTLTASAASTTVSLAVGQVTDDSAILLSPRTANASAEIGAGTIYAVPSGSSSNFVITHANNAQNDRTFRYVIVG